MIKNVLMAGFIFMIPFLCQANLQCRYAIEAGSDPNVRAAVDSFSTYYKIEAPRVIEDTKCGIPICVGEVACLSGGRPMAVAMAYCKAVKIDGDYKCPSATACIDDPDVATHNVTLPVRTQISNNGSSGQGTGGADGVQAR